jgi:galactose-1-phosphate uridylyltransferase
MAVAPDVEIVDLDQLIAGLSRPERSLFERVFNVDISYGRLNPPESMRPWIEEHFGRVESTQIQKIVKVTNLITLEGVMFNWLRSHRPTWKANGQDLDAELARDNHDPLDDPHNDTPEDVFGRVEGRYCITASNIAKFDGLHSLIVFKERHPLRFDEEMLTDYIDTGTRWAEKGHSMDPQALYYLFMWNCLSRAGASLPHGHAQVMLGRGMHYAAVESLRRTALLYQAQYRTNYFEDLYRAHASVGCAFASDGVKVIANLTPRKENEVLLMAPKLNASLKHCLYEVLACYRDKLDVSSFNLVIYQPPLAPTEENWEGFPVVVRIVDRGNPSSRTCDIGAMELYAATVISSDPLKLARVLEDTLGA